MIWVLLQSESPWQRNDTGIIPNCDNFALEVTFFFLVFSLSVAPNFLVHSKTEVGKRAKKMFPAFRKFYPPRFQNFPINHAVLRKSYFDVRLLFQPGRSTSFPLRSLHLWTFKETKNYDCYSSL